jgi:hypothetical protein
MDLILEFNEPVVIKLIDNPLVNEWISQLKTQEPWDCWTVPNCVYINDDEKEKYRKQLLFALEDFNDNNKVKFPFSAPSDHEFTRHELNIIHRWFTTGTSFCCWNLNTGPVVNNEDYPVFYEKAAAINDAVHFLENYYDTRAKQLSKNVTYQFFKLRSLTTQDYFQHKVGDWKYLDYDCEYDIFMNWAICGKDFFQSYIDDDDARQWDITAQWSSYYNFFYWDTWGERNKILKSEEFKTYLTEAHRYNTAWQYMPIGKVISGIPQHYSTFKGLKLN